MLNPNIKVKKLNCKSFNLFLISIEYNLVEDKTKITHLYDELYRYIVSIGINVVYEKMFGSLELKNEMLNLRTEVLNKYDIPVSPVSFIEGKPITTKYLSCVNIAGFLDTENKFKIEYKKCNVFNRINSTNIISKDNNFRMFFLGDLDIDNEAIFSFEDLFGYVKCRMEEHRINSQDLLRTWYYLNIIDENYKEFNTSRNKFFDQCGIRFDSKSNILPASTCIGGKSSESSFANMNFLFMDTSNGIERKRVYNSLQNEADGNNYLYAPSFSRATQIRIGDAKIVFISGTASIGKNGETLYKNDPYEQIKKTILNVKDILDSQSLSFSDLHHVVCFFKRKEYYIVYREVISDLGIDDFANGIVENDICRSDLLFEFDAIAVN